MKVKFLLIIFIYLFLCSGCATQRAYEINKNRYIEKQIYKENDPVKIQAWSDGEFVGLQYNFSAKQIMFNDFESFITSLIGFATDGLIVYGTYYGTQYLKDEINGQNNNNPSQVHINRNEDGTLTIRADEVIITP